MPRREQRRSGAFARRALIIGGVQLAAFGLLGERLWRMQAVDAAHYKTLADKNRISARLLAPARGRILDRFGSPVADNRQVWRASLIAGEARNVKTTLAAFERIIPLSPGERARILRDVGRHRRFVPVTLKAFLTWDEMARIEVHAPDLPGVVVDIGHSRVYPYGKLLAHTVGYVARPNEKDVAGDPQLILPGMRIGRTGLEAHGEMSLRGHAGVEQLEVDALGRVVRELGRQPGIAGKDMRTTLDARLHADLRAAMGTQTGSAVVLDATNGEVIAMVSTPSFDPSLFNTGVSQAQWDDWVRDEHAPLEDRSTAGLYPPGSTFKPAVALAALKAEAITPETVIYCPGYLMVGKRRFHCWNLGGHGAQTLHLAIRNSCDVYFYTAAMRTGIDRMAAMAHALGLAMPLDFEVPGTQSGFIPTLEWAHEHHKLWTTGETVIHGIGQGYTLLTPLSLAVMAARIASGRAITPRVVRDDVAREAPALDLQPLWLQAVREGMWEAVNNPQGTAYTVRLDIPGVTMAGKTGTAQVVNVSEAQYREGFDTAKWPWKLRPHGLFIAYAPYDAPRYAAAVVVEHGNEGADSAAPVAKAVMEKVLTRDPARRNTPPGLSAEAREPGSPGVRQP